MIAVCGECSGPSLVRFPFKAIAAMAVNRVIGVGNKLPWHFPEDFKWFKRTTTGHVVVMGRKTYESIGRPLPNRTTIVISRSTTPIAGVIVAHSLSEIDVGQPPLAGREVFICGGAQIYEIALPLCSDLFLTLVKKSVEGDAYFPPFEDAFTLVDTVLQTSEFDILHYRRRQ
jgi:dihydrofolate reductase